MYESDQCTEIAIDPVKTVFIMNFIDFVCLDIVYDGVEKTWTRRRSRIP